MNLGRGGQWNTEDMKTEEGRLLRGRKELGVGGDLENMGEGHGGGECTPVKYDVRYAWKHCGETCHFIDAKLARRLSG